MTKSKCLQKALTKMEYHSLWKAVNRYLTLPERVVKRKRSKRRTINTEGHPLRLESTLITKINMINIHAKKKIHLYCSQ